jgi:hypothetical protein
MDDDSGFGLFLIFAVIFILFLFILFEDSNDTLEDFQKQAIKHNYATYDENNEFQWIIPEE